MKIISYNLNGIRAALNKDLVSWIEIENPEIICFQELKAMEDQFDQELFKSLGYECYWYSAQKKGYSGVAILSKQKPVSVKYGCDNNQYDSEGRVIQLDFEEFSIISVYVPSATNIDRLGFKMDFCEYFLEYIKSIRKEKKNLVICGDFNICREAIDIHDPIRNAKTSGFLPQEREWISRFIKECAFIDSFRHLHSEGNNYSWWTYRVRTARDQNKGWRIDYIFVSKQMKEDICGAHILKDVVHSDHAPIRVEFNL